MTDSPCRQNDFSCSRDGIFDTSSIHKHAGCRLAIIENNSLHQCRLVEVEIGGFVQSFAQEGCLGGGPSLAARIDRVRKVRPTKDATIREGGKSRKT